MIYDRDSLKLDRETVIVGTTAATFPATWYQEVPSRVPTPQEMRSLQRFARLLTHAHPCCMSLTGKSCTSDDKLVMRVVQLHCSPLLAQEHEAARGKSFARREREAVAAAATYVIA